MKLFWVTTPCKYEDWFVVAKTNKQAERFHEYAEGFEPGYASSKLVLDIPKALIHKYKIKGSDWPSHELLNDLGGKIITTNKPRKVNFNGVVYGEGICVDGVLFDNTLDTSGVYLIRIQNTDKYKIGFTKNLKKRIQQLSTGNPENLKIEFFVATTNYKFLEKKLQEKSKEYRIGGEWFQFDECGLDKLIHELFELSAEAPEEYKFYNLAAVSIQARVY